MTTVQSLIALAQAEEEKRLRAQQDLERSANLTSLALLRNLLSDEVWSNIGADWDSVVFSGENATVKGIVEIDGELVPWFAKNRHGGLYIGSEKWNIFEETRRGETPKDAISQFLLRMARTVAGQREKARFDRLNEIERTFGYNLRSDVDPAGFLALRNEAISLAPEQADKFSGLHSGWLAKYEQYQAEQAALAKRDSERRAVEEAFVERKAEWYRRAKEVAEHNTAVTATYQPLVDVPADLILLTYALAGDDGEGGLAVETKEVYCYPSATDNPVFWPVVGPGPEFAPQETHYMHPVSFRKVSIKPSDKVWPVYYTSNRCGQRLVIGPATPDVLVEHWEGELRTISTDDLPSYPDHLTYRHDQSMLDEKAMALAGYEDSSDDLYF